jgi:hypothetical protein
MYTQGIHKILNCHNAAKHRKFDARGTVVSTTATVSVLVVCLIQRNEGLQFTHGTRILFRPDVLCTMPSHPVTHVFLTLEWNSLGRASFQVHESQRNVRLGKLVN